MLKPYDYTKNAGVNLLRKTGVSLLRKSGVSFDRRTGVSFIGISTSPLLAFKTSPININQSGKASLLLSKMVSTSTVKDLLQFLQQCRPTSLLAGLLAFDWQ
jgi:hypothetical protein